MTGVVVVPSSFQDFHDMESPFCWCHPEVKWRESGSVIIIHENPNGDRDTDWLVIEVPDLPNRIARA